MRTIHFRRLVQLAIVAYILIASVRHNTSIEHLPSTDATCPFGAVETLWTFATTGTFVQKIHPSNLVVGLGVFLGVFLGVILSGVSFCLIFRSF